MKYCFCDECCAKDPPEEVTEGTDNIRIPQDPEPAAPPVETMRDAVLRAYRPNLGPKVTAKEPKP